MLGAAFRASSRQRISVGVLASASGFRGLGFRGLGV